jgi:RNA polymerase sigma-70 factor (ECF subfamily)
MRQPVPTIDLRRDLIGLLPKLRRFAMMLTTNPAEADALVQLVCARAIAKSHLWNAETRLDSWLYTITRMLWADEKKKRKQRIGAAPADTDSRNVDPVEAYSSPLQHLIASLPEGSASVFILVGIEGHSYQQASDILAIPVATVMTRLAAARLQFARADALPGSEA